MKRTIRILFTLSVAVSLPLFSFATVLCFRSYRIVDIIDWEPHSTKPPGGHLGLSLESGDGRLGVVFDSADGIDWSRYQSRQKSLDSIEREMTREHPIRRILNADATTWHFWGHGFSKRANYFRLVVPYWSVLLATGIAPILWVFNRRRRTGAGCCVICGYDLRATPDRCPECGTPVPSKTA